jgi:hypothetical protein
MIAPALRIFARCARGKPSGRGVRADGRDSSTNPTRQDLLEKGQVWGLLGAARTRLILPASPVDPASKYSVKLAIVERQLAHLRTELQVQQLQAGLSPGSLPAASVRACESEIARLTARAEVLRKKLVPRPTGEHVPSFDHLFSELQQFVAALTASPTRLARLLALTASPDGVGAMTGEQRRQVLEEERHVQDVAAQLCRRLEGGEWKGFEDITAPLVLGVYELRLGLRLVAAHMLFRSRHVPSLENRQGGEDAGQGSEGAGEGMIRKLLQVPFAYSLESEHSLLQYAARIGTDRKQAGPDENRAGQESWEGEGEGESEMAVLRAVLHAVCVSVGQEARWSGEGAAALEVVTRAYGRLWSKRADRERARRAAEDQSFQFRERAVELKSEAELEEADYAATFVDYSRDFADIEMRAGVIDEDERAEVCKEAEAVAAEAAERRAVDREAKRDAASVINEDDLQMLYIAHLRLAAHVAVVQGVGGAGAGAGESARKQLEQGLRRVSPEALATAASARYAAASLLLEGEILHLPAQMDDQAAPAHLQMLSHSLLELAARSSSDVAVESGAGAAGNRGGEGGEGEDALAIDALARAAEECIGGVGSGAMLPALSSWARKDVMFRDGDSAEAKMLCKPVRDFVARVQVLLSEFPEHAILEQLLLVSNRLLSLPLDSPLGRLLAGLELLHRKALEWESYAAQRVSVRAELMGIEAVIVRWHRIEVHSWPDLLVARARRCAQRPAGLFLSMSSVILAALEGADVHENFKVEHARRANIAKYQEHGDEVGELDWRKEVREVSRAFIESATLGDFAARLDVMRSLALSLLRPTMSDEAQGAVGAERASRRHKACQLLTNLVVYFAQFAPAVAQQLAAQVGPIEREAKGLVTICRWENKDFEALKHNMERSHRQLHKLLTKYDAALAYPVKHLFQQVQDGSLARFWAVDRPLLTASVSGPAAKPEADADGKPRIRRRRGKGKGRVGRGKKKAAAEEEGCEVAVQKQRAGLLNQLLSHVAATPTRSGGAGGRGGAAAKGAGAAGGLEGGCEAAMVMAESKRMMDAGLCGDGRKGSGKGSGVGAGTGFVAVGVGGLGGDVCGEANNFEADAVEEIAGEMLEEAARLKEDGAVRAVKKRALVGWLEELVSLGLSMHASAVPASRKSLDSLLEGPVDVLMVLPLSYQRPLRMPGTRHKEAKARQTAGDYYMRNIALLGRLRTAATSTRNPDLSAGEVSKGVALCEHAVYLTGIRPCLH